MLHIPLGNTRQRVPKHPTRNSFAKHFPTARKVIAGIGASTLLAMTTSPASADAPGRGPTADFEKAYLQFIIDHHYSALRMTELAVGTDRQRDAPIDNPQEGTAPTPNTNPTPAKASESFMHRRTKSTTCGRCYARSFPFVASCQARTWAQH